MTGTMRQFRTEYLHYDRSTLGLRCTAWTLNYRRRAPYHQWLRDSGLLLRQLHVGYRS